MRIFLTSLGGLVVPGLGHLILGRRSKGIAFLVLLGGLFLLGVSLDPDYYQKFGRSILGFPNFDPTVLPPVPGNPDVHEGWVDTASRVLFTYVFPLCVGFFTYIVGHVLQPFLWKVWELVGLVGSPGQAPVTLKDVGYCFAQLAGLLNLLTMMDAYDIGYNEALYEKRWRSD